jgi:AcrR family transcriptional regulator
MQDIFKESGLSAGAVYRYFPAKADLVSEIANDKQATVRAALLEMLARPELPPLPEVFRDFLVVFLETMDVENRMRLLPEAWSAALHDEAVGGIVRQVLGGVRGIWREFVLRYQREGRLAADADPEAVAALLVGLVPGFVIQYLVLGDVDPETVRRGLEGLTSFA